MPHWLFLIFAFHAHADAIQAKFINAKGEEVGQVLIREDAEGLKLRVAVKGLPPGLHGFHVHENGKCEGPGFTSAGDHFNPENARHGLKAKGGPHAGDLPNLQVEKDGRAKVDLTTNRLTLLLGKNSLRKEGGTTLVIHARPDDQKSQPSGNSGKRIACAELR